MALDKQAAELPRERAAVGRVRRPWCVWLAVGLVVFGAVLNTFHLFYDCRLDMSEDESHYWEWSRHLDYGYYSKPPGIAWVFWVAQRLGAALGMNGDGSGAALMPVLRMAAVIFGFCSGLLSLFLARRIFRDDRAALAVIVLSAAVPMFAVGSLLITIDSPMYLCWAATVYCLWRHVEGATFKGVADESPLSRSSPKWLYLAALAAALGMLFKPVLIAIPLFAAIAVYADRPGGPLRRAFKTPHSLGALAIMLLSFVPIIAWNAQHGWVTFRHIATQGGMGAQPNSGVPKTAFQKFLLQPLERLGEYVGGQAGGMGGILFFLLVIAVVAAWGQARTLRRQSDPSEESIADRTRWIFLLSFSVPLWGFYFFLNFIKGTELNWPAASYFTGMIILAGIFVGGWNAADLKLRRAWRVWGTAAIALGVLITTVAMNAYRLYPLAAEKLKPLAGTEAYGKSYWNPRKWDQPAAGKLRGMRERAAVVDEAFAQMQKESGDTPLVIGRRYGSSSSLAFYMKGHPEVFCMMSATGERMSQYDIWPGLNQKGENGQLRFAGRSALIVASDPDKAIQNALSAAFERVEGPQRVPVVVNGIAIKEVTLYRAWGFHGMPEPSRGGLY